MKLISAIYPTITTLLQYLLILRYATTVPRGESEMMETADLPLKCVLHVDGDTESNKEALHRFTDQTWQTAGRIAENRKTFQQRSKYLNICNTVDFTNLPLPHYGFHTSCYNRFTSYEKKTKERSSKTCRDDTVTTRSSLPSDQTVYSSSTSGILEKKCIFCLSGDRKHFAKRFENLSTCETLQAQDVIKQAARHQGNADFLREYEHIDFIAKEVKYHETCRKRFLSKGTKAQMNKDDGNNMNMRDSAFCKLISYIDHEIFHREESKKLVDINDAYVNYLIDEGMDMPTSEPYNLLSKLKTHYGRKINIEQKSKKQGTYLSMAKDAMKNEIKDVALYLREKILQLKQNELPTTVTAESINCGQVKDIPSELTDFYRVLYTGSNEEGSERVERYVESAAEDDISRCFHTKNG